MQYLKRNTKFSILAFLVLILSITISIFTLAKVNFLPTFPTSPKPEVQTININTASQGEFIKILKLSEPLARKIIASPLLPQLPEITTLDWQEWKEEGVTIRIFQDLNPILFVSEEIKQLGNFVKILKHKKYKMCFDYVNRLAPEE